MLTGKLSLPQFAFPKSTAGRYRPLRVAEGPIAARCRFIKNATSWVVTLFFSGVWLVCYLSGFVCSSECCRWWTMFFICGSSWTSSILQSNLNRSNTDGSFTMAESNSFLSPYEILPIAPEKKKKNIFKEIFLFYHEIICCVYSLESPHRGDSNEYSQHTIIV